MERKERRRGDYGKRRGVEKEKAGGVGERGVLGWKLSEV